MPARVRNMLAVHEAVVNNLGFKVWYESDYEKLYDQGQSIAAEAFDGEKPVRWNEDAGRPLMGINDEEVTFGVELWYWPSKEAQNIEDDPMEPSFGVETYVARNPGVADDPQWENVNQFLSDRYMNIIEAVGVWRVYREQYMALKPSQRPTPIVDRDAIKAAEWKVRRVYPYATAIFLPDTALWQVWGGRGEAYREPLAEAELPDKVWEAAAAHFTVADEKVADAIIQARQIDLDDGIDDLARTA